MIMQAAETQAVDTQTQVAPLYTSELKNFLDVDGRLKQYPSKYKLKIMALFYLASKFEPRRRYTEKEVNEVLKQWHTFSDWSMLRRDLYDREFFNRNIDGSEYWLEPNQPSPESFDIGLGGSD